MLKKQGALNFLFSIIIFFNLFFTHQAIANIPVAPCESVCKTDALLSNGDHCIVLNNKIHMYYKSLGSGAPTMIFASGTGFPAIGWFDTHIANEMAKKVRVFAYDRIFTHNSCPNQNAFMPVTAQDVVHNLRELLKQEHIKPPYILVGQSFGGLYMQLYAREYPDEVAGMLLMDSVTKDGPVTLTAEEEDFLARHHMDHPQKPSPTNPLYNEIMGQLPSYLQVQKAPPLPKDMPLIVMYATKECLPKVEGEKQLCMDGQRLEEHFKQQISLYNSSSIHKLVKVEGEHMSFFDPDKYVIVMNELNKILEMSQDRTKQILNRP